MASKKPTIDTMKKTGEELAAVRAELRGREEKWKEETDHLYEREAELKAKLLADLDGVGLASFKSSSGEMYSISQGQEFQVVNPIALDAWARTNRCVAIDKKALKSRLLDAFKKGQLPDFVKAVPKKTISIKGPKKEKEEAAD